MAFKLRQPIKIDPVARYEVPFQPDNFEDKTGLVARANDNGNMIVNKNIPKDSKLRKVAESHEDNHLRAMMDGKLAYDEEAVYHNMDGKGMKRTPRSEFSESDRTTPWEAPAYKAGENMAKVDMRPKKNKLNRSSEVEAGKFAFAFREINKPMRKMDQETVSMSENFGTAMVKKFGIGPNLDTDLSGNPEGEDEIKAKAKANAEAELAKKNYTQETMPDGRIRFYKEAEGSAGGTDNVVIGSKAKSGQTQATDGDAYIQRLLKQGKTREEVMEGSLTSSKFYDMFPSSKETATASDEYFKDAPPTTKTPPTKTPPVEEIPDCEEDEYYSKHYKECRKKVKFKGGKKKKTRFKPEKLKPTCYKGQCFNFGG
tara:strand:+ start:852 stop:1961 length:1110 start_codon:yes stop_codon:yes gene_type:complete